ncbi:winged helix-turn-helix transcriptional regulator [Aurantivibrio infirmus]
MQYGQFCPIAKAAEILGDKWSLLIVRELLMGGNRFNVLQRGLGGISPTILTKRLNDFAAQGILIKKKIQGQKGYEYFLTECGKELLPLVKEFGTWGMRWARDGMPESDLDAELLIMYLERSIVTDKLIGNESVIRFQFTDLEDIKTWWLVIKGDEVDACISDPGKDIDVYITTDLRTMIELWMGDLSYSSAIADKKFTIVGPTALTKNISSWMNCSIFEGIAPAKDIRHAG